MSDSESILLERKARKKGTSEGERLAAIGQFLTPPAISKFMADMFTPLNAAAIRLLDAGAGAGALTEAFVCRWAVERREGATLRTAAFEMDPKISPALESTLAKLVDNDGFAAKVSNADFIKWASDYIATDARPCFTHAIMNPPYKKISSASEHRKWLRSAGIETVNLYSGFVALAVQLLEENGQLVAIIPRSFCNGPYYEPFRRFILERAAIRRIHLFDSRTKAFQDDGVLQENVIIHLEREGEQGDVVISTSSDDSFTDITALSLPFSDIVFPDDAAHFIHIPTDSEEVQLHAEIYDHSLSDLEVQVSTGPVVDFRMKDDLQPQPQANSAPLLYPAHFAGGRFNWPIANFKKANAIAVNDATKRWLFPGGYYAVVRRFSSKEERRRVVCNIVDPAQLPHPLIGFENHLNVFHQSKAPLPDTIAWGLCAFLNSTAVDKYFRRFNGHTQVNATDLRKLRYPSRKRLEELGSWAMRTGTLSQDQIDAQVQEWHDA